MNWCLFSNIAVMGAKTLTSRGEDGMSISTEIMIRRDCEACPKKHTMWPDSRQGGLEKCSDPPKVRAETDHCNEGRVVGELSSPLPIHPGTSVLPKMEFVIEQESKPVYNL